MERPNRRNNRGVTNGITLCIRHRPEARPTCFQDFGPFRAGIFQWRCCCLENEDPMKILQFTESQVAFVLQKSEASVSIVEIRPKAEISDVAY
jgi:hypothetical protein